MISLIAAFCILLPGQEKDPDAPEKKDSTLRKELDELELSLLNMEAELRRKSTLPPVDETITAAAGSQPYLIGRIENAVMDGPSMLLTLQLLPWKDQRMPIQIHAATGRNYVDVSRRERKDPKGLIVYIWFRQGSQDDVVRAVFGKEKPYTEWETANEPRIDAIRREIAQRLSKRRDEIAQPLYKASADRLRERELKKEYRELVKELKAPGGKGPNGYVLAKDLEKRTVTVGFWFGSRQIERTWPLAKKNLILFRRDMKGTLEHLGIGCRVHLWFSGAERKELAVIEGFGGHVGGFHGAPGKIDFERRTLTILPGKSVKHPGTYIVGDDTEIEVDGREANFRDLDPKQPFRLQLCSDMKHVIAVYQGRRPK